MVVPVWTTKTIETEGFLLKTMSLVRPFFFCASGPQERLCGLLLVSVLHYGQRDTSGDLPFDTDGDAGVTAISTPGRS